MTERGDRIDLHTHSIYSDGSSTVAQLVAHASDLGIAAIALTDHDTLSGLGEFMRECETYGVGCVPGVEFSSGVKGEESFPVHILGYYFDPESRIMREVFAQMQEDRRQLHYQYMEKINAAGFTITEEEIKAVAPVGGVGRAHYARVMMDRGYVSSVKEGFEKYFNVGMPLYIERKVLDPKEAVSIIHEAGGAAFFAHPHQTKLSDEKVFAFMKEMRDAGLDGIEGYYSEFTPEMGKKYRAMASTLGLLLSGGSDYHAEMKPHIELGIGTGDLFVPRELLEPIRERAEKYK